MTLILSPLAAAVDELAVAPAVTAIVGLDPLGVRRVRAIEPGPGDALGAGQYRAFVVVFVLDSAALSHNPVRSNELGIRAYAPTYPEAEALWLACEGVFRDRGARRAASGLGIWWSNARSIGPDQDPDTKQPVWHGTVTYPTTIGTV